ncbi:unnamed protein product, partial [Nesidiocoris tenuis]
MGCLRALNLRPRVRESRDCKTSIQGGLKATLSWRLAMCKVELRRRHLAILLCFISGQ